MKFRTWHKVLVLASLSVMLSACTLPFTKGDAPDEPVASITDSASLEASQNETSASPSSEEGSEESSTIASTIQKPDPVKPIEGITSPAVMYFVDKNSELTGVQVDLAAHTLTAENLMDRLLAGVSEEEKAEGYSSKIPEGTKLNSIQMKETIAVVDLSSEFAAQGDDASMKMRVSQVVNTLSQIYGVEAVSFQIDGKEVEKLGGIELSGPQTAAMWPVDL
ncbi:MAG: GerMN domain-containing protein [Coriobacteriia bacterium]|nr:GerMN domain-containing protein [Coriobacteriia bacterium]